MAGGTPAAAAAAAAPARSASSSSSPSSFGGWKHRAAQFYFLIIFFSFPIFSFPCQKGSCSSPVEIVALNLLWSGVSESFVKGLLYPGAVFSKVESVALDTEPFSFPDWEGLLKDRNITLKNIGISPKLGFVVGSYLCIIGAFLSMVGTTLVSACGMLTLLWFIYTLGGSQSDIFALPMFAVALFCAISGLLKVGGLLRRGDDARAVSPHASSSGKGTKKN